MNSRRGFFKRLGAFAATIALAPQLAFRTSPLRVGIDVSPVDDTYACVIERVTPETVLYSEEFTITLPPGTLFIENFSHDHVQH